MLARALRCYLALFGYTIKGSGADEARNAPESWSTRTKARANVPNLRVERTMTTKILTGDRCQCAACLEYFNSTRAFDRHRRGVYPDRRCRTPDEMTAAGMSVNAAGFWITNKFDADASRRMENSGDRENPVGE